MSYILMYLIICLCFSNFVDESFNTKKRPIHWSLSALLTLVWPFVIVAMMLVIFLNVIWDIIEYFLGVKS